MRCVTSIVGPPLAGLMLIQAMTFLSLWLELEVL